MDNQETREVTTTYADGSTVTMTIDRETGALLDYNATPPPPRTTGDGLQALAKRVAALEANPEAEHVDLEPLSERVADLESRLTTAQKVIDWLGGDLLRVTPDIPTRDGKFAATRMFPFAVRLPGGIHAYALRTDRDLTKTMDFEMIGEGKNIPAYTPVFLMAKESKEYILSPAPYSAPIDTGLMGTLQPLTVEMRDHDKYKYFALVLNKKGESQFLVVPNNKKIIIPPYRAFLRLPKDYVYNPAEVAESSAETAPPTDK